MSDQREHHVLARLPLSGRVYELADNDGVQVNGMAFGPTVMSGLSDSEIHPLVLVESLVVVEEPVWHREQAHPASIGANPGGAGYLDALLRRHGIGPDGDQNPLRAPLGHKSYIPVYVQFTASGLRDDTTGYAAVRDVLSTQDGVRLRRVGGVGLRGQSDILGRGLPPGTDQSLSAYDTTGAHVESGRLLLRLEVTVAQPAGPSGEVRWIGLGGEGSGGQQASEPQQALEPGPAGTNTGLSPLRFVFYLSIPVN